MTITLLSMLDSRCFFFRGKEVGTSLQYLDGFKKKYMIQNNQNLNARSTGLEVRGGGGRGGRLSKNDSW